MKGINRRSIAVVLATVLPLALTGCGDSDKPEHDMIHPATVEPSGDSGISRVTLTDRAVERLGIQLADVVADGDKLVAPYSALLYDANGGTWIYVSPQPNVFKRAAVTLNGIEGDKLYMTSGPVAGSKVVIVGAAELYGAEFEVGH